MTDAVTASAPGKTILMGEHAVVYGRPALVAALGLRARARLAAAEELSPGQVELRLPDLGVGVTTTLDEITAHADAARRFWMRTSADGSEARLDELKEGDPAHVVKVAVGEASRAAGLGAAPPVGLRLRVASDIPVGCGFGSSAAVGAAVSGAWLAWHGVSLDEGRRARLLLDVERRQHGDPSGVDSAVVLRGGGLWVEGGQGDELRVRRAELHPGHLSRLRVVDTGTPAQDTGRMVAFVRQRRGEDPERFEAVLDRMGDRTRRFRRVLSDADAGVAEVRELVGAYERDLEALGVVPPRARELVRAVEERGGAAKISGAGALTSPAEGAPGAGAMLIYHPEPGAVGGWEPLDGLAVYDVDVGAEGQRLEDVA